MSYAQEFEFGLSLTIVHHKPELDTITALEKLWNATAGTGPTSAQPR